MSWRFAQPLRRLATHLHEGGVLHTLEVASANRLIPGAALYRRCTHLLQLDNSDRLQRFRPRPEYDYTTAQPGDIDELAALDRGEDPLYLAGLFLGFFKTGATCYTIRKRGEILAYSWLFDTSYTVTHDAYGARQLDLALGTDESVFGNGYIAPEYRMKGLFPFLIQMAVQDRGPKTAFYSTIDRLNDNSLRSHQRLGFDVIGTATCQRLAGSPYFWTWRAPRRRVRFLGFGQPQVVLRDLIAVPDQRKWIIGKRLE